MNLRDVFATRAPAATILIRLMVGAVFFSQEIQKFLFPELRGTGRFAKIGFPAPDFLGYFVGTADSPSWRSLSSAREPDQFGSQRPSSSPAEIRST